MQGTADEEWRMGVGDYPTEEPHPDPRVDFKGLVTVLAVGYRQGIY